MKKTITLKIDANNQLISNFLKILSMADNELVNLINDAVDSEDEKNVKKCKKAIKNMNILLNDLTDQYYNNKLRLKKTIIKVK